MEGKSFTQIRVINRNTFPLVDRYDGVQYVFPPDVAVTVPADVATHIFGYGPEATEEALFRHITRRFGWNTPQMVADEAARLYFDNLDIKPVQFRMVPVEQKEDEPADPYPGEDGTEPLGSTVRTTRGRGRPPKRRLTPRERAPDDNQETPAAPAAA